MGVILLLQNASCYAESFVTLPLLSVTPNASNFMKEKFRLFYEDSKLYATKRFANLLLYQLILLLNNQFICDCPKLPFIFLEICKKIFHYFSDPKAHLD